MFYKLFNEPGRYISRTTGASVNMMEVESALTPEGLNVGWDYFETIEEAISHYNIRLDEVNDGVA